MVKAHKHINLQRLIDELQANEYVHLKGKRTAKSNRDLSALCWLYCGFNQRGIWLELDGSRGIGSTDDWL